MATSLNWSSQFPSTSLGSAKTTHVTCAGRRHSVRSCANSVNTSHNHFTSSSSLQAQHLLRAAQLADSSAGLTAPHTNSGCVIAHGPRVVGEGFLYAEGTRSAEVQAVESARDSAEGAVAYLNLEPEDWDGDDSAVLALKQARVSRVVVGLQHPLVHLRGKAIKALRREGIPVDVLGEDLQDDSKHFEEALKACRLVNVPLLYRVAHHIPFSVLKYAMTLDGKIAASTGHAAWVSSSVSRNRVFAARGRSDAIIVGGNTVRRDNPSLTTRQIGGHRPARIVLSRCLNLPEDANLWNVSDAPTIVVTQKGARSNFQAKLASRGVEIVEFDFLTPKAVMDYCYDRGYLSVLWECGGTLSAPAISSHVIHKVIAFVAPKIIGGVMAPSPVGELGMVEMTQALNLSDVSFEQTGPDMLITGYLEPIPTLRPPLSLAVETSIGVDVGAFSSDTRPAVISFYKTWDAYGAFSNFSRYPIIVPESSKTVIWKSVEHYYQAQKFFGVQDPVAEDYVKRIQSAESGEEAARLGRMLARDRPDLVRPDWDSAKLEVMYLALRSKYTTHLSLRKLLLSTVGSILVEASVTDVFWGSGRSGTGLNHLGRMLMKIRSELLEDAGRKQTKPTKVDGCTSVAL